MDGKNQIPPEGFFYFMPTSFQRIRHYCQTNKIPVFTKEQRIDINKLIWDTYIAQKPPRENINKVEVESPEGKKSVVSYPKYFIETIDKIIHEYRTILAAKAWDQIKSKMDSEKIILPERKRIRKQIPVFTLKNK